MALSFFSYSDTVDNPTADMSSFLHEQHSEVADALLGFCEPFFDGLDPPMLFDPLDDVFCSDANATLLPSFSDSSIVSLLPELHAPCDEFGLCQCPKRPRSCSDLYHPSDLMFEADTFYAPATGPALANYSVPEFLTEFGVPPPPVAGLARNDDSKRSNNGCLSTQSMAARERRKRISNKTQELGRLIPGGSKMNTAEMLQAAYKYVKFLQAQVGILGLMNSLEGCKVSAEREEQLQVLLTSPKIHEKLCVEGKCMVPEEMAETLLEDHQIKLNQVLFKDLSCFIDSVQRLEGDGNVKESA